MIGCTLTCLRGAVKVLLLTVTVSPAPILVKALTVTITFVPGSKDKIVKFNVVLFVTLKIVMAFIVYET